MRARSGIRVGGSVTTTILGPDGLPVRTRRFRNTACQYGLAAYASWITGVYNTPLAGGATNIVGPGYVALGTGTAVPAVGDLTGFAEVYGTRKPITYTQLFTGDTAMLVSNYLSTDPSGTFTETMLFDADVGSAAIGTGGAPAAATEIPLGAGAPAVLGGSAAGQYTTAYIDDGASSEYIGLAAPAAAGAYSWFLRAPLQYPHAAAVPIVVFTGNLFGHSAISETKSSTQGMTLQWSIPMTAS